MPSCPPPFLDDAPYSRYYGNVPGRLCSDVLPLASPNTTCCLPCPVQNYVLRPSSLNALHVNDMVNVVGFVIGIFILLVCLTSAKVNIQPVLYCVAPKRYQSKLVGNLCRPLAGRPQCT